MQKQLEGTQKYINEQCIERHISMGNSCNYCEQYTIRASAEYKCPALIKPSNRIYECLLGFVLTTFLRRHKFWLHRQFSSAQFQKRRNDG